MKKIFVVLTMVLLLLPVTMAQPMGGEDPEPSPEPSYEEDETIPQEFLDTQDPDTMDLKCEFADEGTTWVERMSHESGEWEYTRHVTCLALEETEPSPTAETSEYHVWRAEATLSFRASDWISCVAGEWSLTGCNEHYQQQLQNQYDKFQQGIRDEIRDKQTEEMPDLSDFIDDWELFT